MTTGPATTKAPKVRLILYQFENTWQTNFRHWLSFWDPNNELLLTDAQNASDVHTDLATEPEIRILIFAAKTESSQNMVSLWQSAGIRYIFTAQQFMSLYRPVYIEPLAPIQNNVLFLDDDPSRFFALESVLEPFGCGIFNAPGQFQKERLTSWLDFPGIKSYPVKKWGNRPLLILNLDHPNVALQPILHSLEHEHYLPIGGEKVLFRPKLLPFKDFALGSVWDEIQAGIRRFSKVILSFPELLQGIFEINLQQSMFGLDQQFAKLAERNLNQFQTGNFADHLTNPATFQVWPQLEKIRGQKFQRLDSWRNAYGRLEFLTTGLSWLWQTESGELKAPQNDQAPQTLAPRPDLETG